MTPYVRHVLDRFRTLPTAAGTVRSADRRLAEQLERDGVPLSVVEAALHLAALRRLLRPPGADPLPPIRSLHYLTPLLDEIRRQQLPPDYLDYLQQRLDREVRRPHP